MARRRPTPEEAYEKLTAHKRSKNPVTNGKAFNVEEGDNAKYTSMALAIAKMPAIDIKNAQQMSDRVEEYFQIYINNDMKPNVVGLAMALGIDRRALWAYANGTEDPRMVKIPRECSDIIKKAYMIMELQWQEYMQNGKINPASGIFLGKNLYGYKDVVENVIVPEVRTDQYSVEDITKRYAIEEGVVEPSGGSNSDGGSNLTGGIKSEGESDV